MSQVEEEADKDKNLATCSDNSEEQFSEVKESPTEEEEQQGDEERNSDRPQEEREEQQEEKQQEEQEEEHGEDKEGQDEEREEEEEDEEDFQLPALLRINIEKYEGETKEELPHGKGVACFEGGHMFTGTFSKGLMDGHGVFTWSKGMKYEGEFVSNMPMGQGTYTWANGSSYTGEIYNGKRHGTGSYTCIKYGVSYIGQWDQGKRHGQGVMFFNGSKTSWYKGEWVKNSRQGSGDRCFPSGNTYSGEWKNNLRHGEGTMKWMKLGQEYVGMWQNGVQHGLGTHVWILRRTDISQYSRNNRYTGDFVHGQRHGHGTFFYAGGAVYEGEWRNNKKHGKGKFTFKDGHVFEGQFVDDRMTNMNGNRALTPLCGAVLLSRSGSSVLGPDMTLNIERLLENIPEKRRQNELKQVEFAVLRNNAELRSIYSFYSRLGSTGSPNNIFLLSRLQLWRLLKDCYIHHDITLTEIDRLISEDTEKNNHSPFTSIPLRGLLSCFVIIAYHILSEDMDSPKYLLAACLSKLLIEDILPNAKRVKGFVFRLPDCSATTMTYMKRCWEVYHIYGRLYAGSTDDKMMTYRHLLWLYRDLHLLDDKLTTVKLLKIITLESPEPNNLTSSLSLKITFLEFFEVLLGSAEVKCPQFSQSPVDMEQPSSRSYTDNSDRSELESSSLLSEGEFTNSGEFSSTQESSSSLQEGDSEARRLSAERREERQRQRQREREAKHQMIHQFFNDCFFPAVEHHQLITKMMKEEGLSS
ncbi:radial spoke head 10 homolog B isoform X2 [Cynoglossus semilaevis]|uniref:Radial spoke head 10 homolog B n=1 Tax=Cynoglossus semilaevis TaxID=244447 RepID=A0A3P8UF30_CYNSE|nr:radial spoke head 10 homolog B isoform X2 [Cynoglossus semilaevis]